MPGVIGSEKRVDRAEVERLTRLGRSAKYIAVRLNCSDRTVTRIRAELGISDARNGSYGPVPPARLRLAEVMLDDGASYAEVSRSIGMAWETLRRHFPGRGMSPQVAGGLSRMVQKFNNIQFSTQQEKRYSFNEYRERKSI